MAWPGRNLRAAHKLLSCRWPRKEAKDTEGINTKDVDAALPFGTSCPFSSNQYHQSAIFVTRPTAFDTQHLRLVLDFTAHSPISAGYPSRHHLFASLHAPAAKHPHNGRPKRRNRHHPPPLPLPTDLTPRRRAIHTKAHAREHHAPAPTRARAAHTCQLRHGQLAPLGLHPVHRGRRPRRAALHHPHRDFVRAPPQARGRKDHCLVVVAETTTTTRSHHGRLQARRRQRRLVRFRRAAAAAAAEDRGGAPADGPAAAVTTTAGQPDGGRPAGDESGSRTGESVCCACCCSVGL